MSLFDSLRDLVSGAAGNVDLGSLQDIAQGDLGAITEQAEALTGHDLGGLAEHGQALQEGGLGGVADSVLGDVAGSGDAAP